LIVCFGFVLLELPKKNSTGNIQDEKIRYRFLTICFLVLLPRHVGLCSAWLRILWLPQSHQN